MVSITGRGAIQGERGGTEFPPDAVLAFLDGLAELIAESILERAAQGTPTDPEKSSPTSPPGGDAPC